MNRAGKSSAQGAAGQQNTTILPVGTRADVFKVLELVLPGLRRPSAPARSSRRASRRRREGDGFTNSPRRAAILRWFSWRRNGFALTTDAAILRRGAIWRELVVVPAARMQSVSVSQGPLYRALRLGRVHAHTVAGPISARLGALDVGDASAFFRELSRDGRRRGGRRPLPPLAVGRVTPRAAIRAPRRRDRGRRAGRARCSARRSAAPATRSSASTPSRRPPAIAPTRSCRACPVLDVPAIIERSELVLLAVPGDRARGSGRRPRRDRRLAARPARRPHRARLRDRGARPGARGGRDPARDLARRWRSPARASTWSGCASRGARSPRPVPCCRSRRRSSSRWAASRSSSPRRIAPRTPRRSPPRPSFSTRDRGAGRRDAARASASSSPGRCSGRSSARPSRTPSRPRRPVPTPPLRSTWRLGRDEAAEEAP